MEDVKSLKEGAADGGERRRTWETHPNARIVRGAWEAIAASDVPALDHFWASDIVWHVTGESRWTGDYIGQEAVLNYLADIGEAGDAYEARLDDVLVSHDRTVVLYHVSAARRGKTIESDQVMLARIDEGLVAEVWTLPLDPQALRDFYADGSQAPAHS